MTKQNKNFVLGELAENASLRQKILEMESLWLQLVHKKEVLKIELIKVKRVFDKRFGKLYQELDLLNIQIQKKQQIRQLIKQGYGAKQAEEQVEEFFAQETERVKAKYRYDIDKRHKKMRLLKQERIELKTLWRQLALKYHPDLAETTEERGRREEVMKQINRAYAEEDLEALKKIENKDVNIKQRYDSLEKLKQRLSEMINACDKAKKEYRQLLGSEWNIWKTKLGHGENNKENILDELERKLRNQIKEKQIFLENLNA